MSKCENPNCTRNHELEGQIANVCEDAARKVAVICGGGPQDAIHGLAMALVSSSFYTSIPGKEKEAADDLVALVQHLSDMILEDEASMKLKRERDAEEVAQRPAANTLPI